MQVLLRPRKFIQLAIWYFEERNPCKLSADLEFEFDAEKVCKIYNLDRDREQPALPLGVQASGGIQSTSSILIGPDWKDMWWKDIESSLPSHLEACTRKGRLVREAARGSSCANLVCVISFFLNLEDAFS